MKSGEINLLVTINPGAIGSDLLNFKFFRISGVSKMKNAVWVGFGLAVGIGIGLVLKVAFNGAKQEPILFKKFAQKGDFALRDTERALSRAEF
jgi:hypothetical protein